jgi:hypothetical protein
MNDAQGWPFLIGAGHRHEYRTLIAPAFLIAAAEYGILDRHAGRTPDGETRVVQIRSTGHPLWMAYATHTVTAADVPDPRDEHGRPLQVLAGFVCDTPIERPDPGDLAVVLDTGLAVYRRYLEDEDRFGVLASEAFPLRSVLRPAAAPAAALAPRLRPGGMSRRTVTMLGLAAALVAAAVTTLLVTLSGGAPQPVCTPPPAAAGPSPTCG